MPSKLSSASGSPTTGPASRTRSRKRATAQSAVASVAPPDLGSVDDDRKTPVTPARKKAKKKLTPKKQARKPATIIFGDDDDIDPDEIDERGNIKDLIDYSDEKDYAKYERAIAKREMRERKMLDRPHITFASESSESEDSDYESDPDYDDDEEMESGDPLGMLIPFFLNGRQPDAQSDIQARILASELPDATKEMVIKRLELVDLDKPKVMEWVESLLSIPFGKFVEPPVKATDPQPKLAGFFNDVITRLDSQVYGMVQVKQEIVDYLAQYIKVGCTALPRCLALCGSPGVGKSMIIRRAFAEALGRPLCVINMGGIKDSSYLTGFDYTYAGSRYGAVVQKLMEKQVMNPIILCEEIDKISETHDGHDIQYTLMHATDPEQNMAFQDKYFAGIDIDLSKVIFAFTFNNRDLVHPVLRDRLHIIDVPDPTWRDKINIGRLHMLPEVAAKAGLDQSLVIVPDEMYSYLLDRHCAGQKGMRKLKECLETIARRLNTIRLIGFDPTKQVQVTGWPVFITRDLVDVMIVDSHRDENPLVM